LLCAVECINTLKGFAIEGKFGLFSCFSTHPSFLKVTTDDSSSSLFGRIELAECDFIANCFQSWGRKLYTLATCFSDELAEVNIEGMEIDSECDDQQVLLINYLD
jgi:hypothetical protein